MGSLIFLLLATTTRMRDLAIAEAEAKRLAAYAAPSSDEEPDSPLVSPPVAQLGTPEKLEPVQPSGPSDAERELEQQRQRLEQEWKHELAELIRKRDQLYDDWKKQQSVLKTAQSEVSHLEETIGEQETRLRGVLAEVDSLKESPDSAAELARLEDEIIQLRLKLRRLQNRPTEGSSKFAVVPFDVRSGTTRRPILIECTDTGLRFLPEDIVVSPTDLEGFSERVNPLLVGATALANYWSNWNLQQPHPEQEPEPYVLLIVRPNGIVAYYVAMRMLSGLKTPFGYELVDESIALQPPPVDPKAKETCQLAIADLMAQRSNIAQQVEEGFRGPGRGGSGNQSIAKRGSSGGQKSSDPSFTIDDVLNPSRGVGDRTWENIDRFEGRRPAQTKHIASNHGTGRPKNSPSSFDDKEAPTPATSLQSSATSQTKTGREKKGAATSSGLPRESTLADLTTSDEENNSDNIETSPVEMSESGEFDSTENSDSSSANSVPSNRNLASANQLGQNQSSMNQSGESQPAEMPPNTLMSQSRQMRNRDRNASAEAMRLESLSRRHWGDSDPYATIGLEQDVTIRIDSERIIVAEDRELRLQPNELPMQTFLRMIEAVDQEAHQWGKSRSGFYWTPRLRFIISPGGNQVYDRIQPITARTGLSTTEDYILEGVEPAVREVAP